MYHPPVHSKKTGFTLIELLVVISIIRLLSSIILVIFNNVKKKARDAVRLEHMRQIENALQFYILDKGVWPNANNIDWELDGCSDVGGLWDSSNVDKNGDGNNFIDFLKTSGYFPSGVPNDPLNDGNGCEAGSHNYVFYVKLPGYLNCPGHKGNFYLLGIKDMETSEGRYPSSPNFSCGDIDWNTKFEWFTGKFEK